MTTTTRDATSLANAGARRRIRRAMLAALATISITSTTLTPAVGAQPTQSADVPPPVSLEPLDPIVEDFVVPDVLVPAGDVLSPVGDSIPNLYNLPLLTEENQEIFEPLPDLINRSVMQLVRLLRPSMINSPAVYDLQASGHANEDSFRRRQRTALEGVPQLIDISGNGVVDISVEVRNITTTPTLRVLRLPGAPTVLAGEVKVTLAPNGWSAPERLTLSVQAGSFGSPDRGLPTMTRVVLRDPAHDSDDLAVDIETTDPGDGLFVSVLHDDQLFPNATMLATLSPVPAEVTITATGLMTGFDSGTVSLTTSETTSAEVALRPDDTLAYLVADGMTDGVEVEFTRDALASLVATLSATGPVDSLSIQFDDRPALVSTPRHIVGGGVDDMAAGAATLDLSRTRFTSTLSASTGAVEFIHNDDHTYDRGGPMSARLEGIPDSLTLNLEDVVGSSVAVDLEGQDVARLDLHLGNQPIPLDDSMDGVWLSDVGDPYIGIPSRFGVRARLSNPESLAITTVDGLDSTTSTSSDGSRPFVMGTTRSDSRAGARCMQSPDDCPFAMAVLSSTPKDVHVQMNHEQSALETTFGYTVSTPVDELLVAIDADHESYSQSELCGGGMCFSGRVEQPPSAVSAMVDRDSFWWSASDGVPRLDVGLTHVGYPRREKREVTANLFDVPADLSMDFGDDATGSGEPVVSVGPLRILASEPTTLNLLSTTSLGSQTISATSAENLRAQSFGIEGTFTDCGVDGQQVCGHLWIDTLPVGGSTLADAHGLEGTLRHRSESIELDFAFGEAFRAARRKAVFSSFPGVPSSPASITTTGELACTPDTLLDGLQVSTGLTFDVRELVC